MLRNKKVIKYLSLLTVTVADDIQGEFESGTFDSLMTMNVQFQEVELEGKLQDLATKMAPLYQQMAPDAYSNQVCQSDGCSNVT